MIARHTDRSDPAVQEQLIREPLSRVGRRRKYSAEILDKGYALAKELGSVKAAAEVIGVNYYALRDWTRSKDRRTNPALNEARRSTRKTKHSLELLKRLLAQATAMERGGRAGFLGACRLVCAGTLVKPQYLYHLRNSSRLPGA